MSAIEHSRIASVTAKNRKGDAGQRRSGRAGRKAGEQRRSGIVRRLAAPDGASQLASAEGDKKLMRGV
jgi:hypothetical protein